MDFLERETPDRAAFRATVRAWLQAFAPRDLSLPPDGRPLDPGSQERVRAFRRRLGSQGWLAPTYPRELGGGGLTPALGTVVQEEVAALGLPSVGDNYRWVPAMLAWGTEEQRRTYVPPALRGETVTWQLFTEPESGSDLASIRTRAVLEGSGFVITGQKSFITGRLEPDLLWTLAVTDPQRPRRLNLGVFMVDARLPGIEVRTQRLLTGSERRVFLDSVRVPSRCLLGGPYQGWEIAQSVLEGERGGYGFREDDQGTVESVLQFLREERRGP